MIIDFKWRFIKSWNETGVPYGSALNEFFIKQNPEPIIIFRTMPFSLVLGRNQNWNSIDSEKAINDNILISRRLSYGNAVLLSENQIAYAFIIGKQYYNCKKLELFDYIQSNLFKILEKLGIHGHFAEKQITEQFTNLNCMAGIGKNEILNQKNRKLISGTCTELENAYLQEGVIIIDKTIKNVTKYIKEDDWVIQNRKFVMPAPSSLENELGRIVDKNEIVNLMHGIFNIEEYNVNDSEQKEILEIQKIYDSEEWIKYGRYSTREIHV